MYLLFAHPRFSLHPTDDFLRAARVVSGKLLNEKTIHLLFRMFDKTGKPTLPFLGISAELLTLSLIPQRAERSMRSSYSNTFKTRLCGGE